MKVKCFAQNMENECDQVLGPIWNRKNDCFFMLTRPRLEGGIPKVARM